MRRKRWQVRRNRKRFCRRNSFHFSRGLFLLTPEKSRIIWNQPTVLSSYVLRICREERNLGSGQPYPRLVPSSSSTLFPPASPIFFISRRATTPTSLIEFSSSVLPPRWREDHPCKSPPLEVSPALADFYSSHTGFVYNFVPFTRSSRYAIDPAMYLRHSTLVLPKLIKWAQSSLFFPARRSLAASRIVRSREIIYVY